MKNKFNNNIANLTELQKHVTLENGTEQPFNNEYWNNKKAGIYVDIIDGTPLFLSKDKFNSYTGWPSFTKPIAAELLNLIIDKSHNMIRTEVRSKSSDAHLGHFFDDGPKEHGGNRYCINSAALKFIAKEDLKKEGYQEYLKFFIKDHDLKK